MLKTSEMSPTSYLVAGLVGHPHHLLSHGLHVAHGHGGPRRHGHAPVSRGHRHHARGRTIRHLEIERGKGCNQCLCF